MFFKFRIWDDSFKKMHYDGHCWFYQEDKGLKDFMAEEAVIMQWSGLIDTNRRDIYQSDLVKRANDDRIYRVIFDHRGFRPFHRDSVSSRPQDSDVAIDFYPLRCGGRAETFQIIGNIYENPELDSFAPITNECGCKI